MQVERWLQDAGLAQLSDWHLQCSHLHPEGCRNIPSATKPAWTLSHDCDWLLLAVRVEAVKDHDKELPPWSLVTLVGCSVTSVCVAQT